MAKPNPVTPAVRRHWNKVAEIGCLICHGPAEIAHCHGGSISEILGPEFRPGTAQRQNHYLVLPLCMAHHRGPEGLDTGKLGVGAWEECWGTQMRLLVSLGRLLGYSVFELAGLEDTWSNRL